MGIILMPFKLFSVPFKFILGIVGVLIASMIVGTITNWGLSYTDFSPMTTKIMVAVSFIMTIWSAYHED